MGIKHRAPAPPPPTAMASPEPLLSRPIVPAVGQLRAAIRSLDSLHPAPGMSPTSPTSLPAAIAWLTGSRLVPRSSPSSSSLPSLSDDASSATSSSSSSTPPSALASLASLQAADATPIRPNEHLAVFLPKTHWKVRSRLFFNCLSTRLDTIFLSQSDSQASYCETFLCHKKFSVFERRHVRPSSPSSLSCSLTYAPLALSQMWWHLLSQLLLSHDSPPRHLNPLFPLSSAKRLHLHLRIPRVPHIRFTCMRRLLRHHLRLPHPTLAPCN